MTTTSSECVVECPVCGEGLTFFLVSETEPKMDPPRIVVNVSTFPASGTQEHIDRHLAGQS